MENSHQPITERLSFTSSHHVPYGISKEMLLIGFLILLNMTTVIWALGFVRFLDELFDESNLTGGQILITAIIMTVILYIILRYVLGVSITRVL